MGKEEQQAPLLRPPHRRVGIPEVGDTGGIVKFPRPPLPSLALVEQVSVVSIPPVEQEPDRRQEQGYL